MLQALGVRKDGTRQSIAEMEILPAEYSADGFLQPGASGNAQDLLHPPLCRKLEAEAQRGQPHLQRLLKKHYYTWYCPLRGRIEGRLRKRT